MRKILIVNWILIVLIFLFLTGCKKEEKSFTEQLREVNEKIQSDSMDVDSYIKRAWFLRQIYYDNPEEQVKKQVEEDLYTVLKIDTLNSEAYRYLGDLYFSKMDYVKAIECYKKAEEIGMRNLTHYEYLYWFIGCSYDRLERYNEALEYLKKAIAKCERRSNTSVLKYLYYESGCCNLLLLNYSNALKDFEQGLKWRKYDSDTIKNVVYILHILSSEGQAGEALKYLKNIENSFRYYNSEYLYWSGVLYMQMLDTKSAYKCFNKLVTEGRDTAFYAHGYYYLSVISAIEGKRKESKDYMITACRKGFYDYDLLEDWKKYIPRSIYEELRLIVIKQRSAFKKKRDELGELLYKTRKSFDEAHTFNYKNNFNTLVKIGGIIEPRLNLVCLEPKRREEFREIAKYFR